MGRARGILMKICIFGASGFYGRPLLAELAKKHEVIGAAHSQAPDGNVPLDITSMAEVGDFLRAHRPDAVINLAAVTDVDLCEKDRGLARRVNLEGAANITQACRQSGAKLFHFSTEFVFDGKKGNYSENDRPNPVNYYGETKLGSELAALSVPGNAVIRTSTPYGLSGGGKKFVNAAIEKLSRGEPVDAFSDFIRSPTLVEELAENFEVLLKKDFSGIINVAGDSQISMYGACLEIASVFGFDSSLVRESSGIAFPFAAKRPPNTGLDISLSKGLGIKMGDFKSGLARIAGGRLNSRAAKNQA